MTAGRRVAAFLLALPMAVTVPIAAAATPPSAPPTVRAVAITPTEVILEWEPGSPDVTSYTVRRDGAVLASVNPATLTFSDATVLAGRRYSYVVEAVSPGGTAATAAVRVKTPSPPERQDHNRPTVPEDVHAVALPDGSVLVDWQGSNDDSDISAYVIRLGNRHVATVNSGTLDVHRPEQGLGGGQLYGRGRRHRRPPVGAVGRGSGRDDDGRRHRGLPRNQVVRDRRANGVVVDGCVLSVAPSLSVSDRRRELGR